MLFLQCYENLQPCKLLLYSDFNRMLLLHTPVLFQTGSKRVAVAFRLIAEESIEHSIGIGVYLRPSCDVFLSHCVFYLRAQLGAIMALFKHYPFVHCAPKLTHFWHSENVHVHSLFRLATLVCSPAECGYLTPSLSVPKRTGKFLIFQSSKGLLSHKKAFLFLS